MERIRDDVRRAFEDIARLREARAAQDVAMKELKDDVKALTEAVTGLTSAIDRSRGALWVISGASGAIGAIIAAAISILYHK